MKQQTAVGDQRNYAALDWVMGEIEETLNEARQALEAFVADPKDTTRLRFCITHIHQVRGSLQIVEFHGASLLAEEMELLAQSMMDKTVGNMPDAQEVLMRSLLQLPIYLDHVKVYRDDSARTILPLLNDLRAVRNEHFLSESNLFAPDLSSLTEAQGQRHALLKDRVKLKEVTRKLREMYQFAAASVLRGIKVDENLDYLDKVFARLEALTNGTLTAPLWQAAAALVDGLRSDEIELSVAVRSLLRHLAKELRLLNDGAPEAFDVRPNESLFKNILYYVARSESQAPRIKRLKERFSLKSAELAGNEENVDGYSVSALDPEAVRSVVIALREELKSIKSNLDNALTEHASPSEIADVLPVIKRVGDTLAVLGIGELRRLMLNQAELLEEISKQNSVDESQLTEIAGHIIEVDHKLEAIGKAVDKHRDLANINERAVEIDEAKGAVIRECQIGLERAKESIIEYISSQWDANRLDNIEALLKDIRGGLEMIPLPRPAAVIDSCARFIVDTLRQPGYEPEWKTLESLADAMASVEYYLERLSGDLSEDAESLLEIAEDSVESLGYAVKAINPRIDIATLNKTAELAETGAEAQEAVAEPQAQHTELADEAPAQTEEVAVTPPEAAAESEPETEIPEVPQAAIKARVNPPAKAPDGPIFLDEEPSDIDEEIVEVFIEEAQEVFETLQEYLPKWAANLNDNDALTVVRRSYHTLKGSGRMVEARDIGELAWSVENMLNRIIDKTVPACPEHVALVKAVTELLPTLVEAFSKRERNPALDTCESYSRFAFSLAEGKIPPELSQQSPSAAPSHIDDSAEEQEDDDILYDIFSSEAEGHLESIAEFVADMVAEAPIYSAPTDAAQRAMHTLKGSARMAQVQPIAQMFEALEAFAKELVAFQVPVNDDILQLMRDAETYTTECLRQIAKRETPAVPRLDQFLARCSELRELAVGHLVRMKEAQKDGEKQVDPKLLSIFMAEEMRLLLDADDIVRSWLNDSTVANQIEELIQELNNLAAGADSAQLPDMSRLAQGLMQIHRALLANYSLFNQEICHELIEFHNALLDMIDAVAAGQNLPAPAPGLMQRLEALGGSLQQASTQAPPESFYADADADSDTAEELSFDAGPVENFDYSQPEFADTDSDTTSGDDFSLEDEVIGGFDEPLEFGASEVTLEEEENLDLGADSGDWILTADSGVEDIEFEPSSEEATLPMDGEDMLADVDENAAQPVDEEPLDEAAEDLQEAVSELVEEEAELEAKHPTGAASGLLDEIDASAEDFDPDILEIFLEEAQELFEQLDEAISAWERDPEGGEGPEEMKRALHTMKGGARLSGLNRLGELVHDYESYLIGLDSTAADPSVFANVQRYQDRIDKAIQAVRRVMAGETVEVEPIDNVVVEETFEAEEAAAADIPAELGDTDVDVDVDASTPSSAQQDKHNVIPFVAKPRPPAAGSDMDDGSVAMGGNNVAALKKSQGPQEVVRVSSDLLEELVNLAGETSISRARLEEQVTEFRFSLEEIDSTISRLQEQLRRLDIETEAQILFRQEQMAVHDENFDPLEMDRYSALQQLSRSLIESASDLYDLRSELTDKVKDAETILLQQSRINTTLQEGLMRSRMVPFSRMVPRLRRIVRQVATELGKKVSLELDNVEGELDRNVLERMVPPFEHMLRNAVDHGIEMPEDRIAAGKPETGRIVLTLGREGSDVIIRLADDGRGINLKRVREKAIERGLMTESAQLSDYDITQFILHAGFSTAESITQISGRGVGMDVVHAEIKQLGGDVSIHSQWGKGTEFVIRLPFTLSVNRALMTSIGQDRYAIPLTSIEGIVRISPFELEHYYQNPDAEFEYANEKYHVRYLGSMLYPGLKPNLEGHILPLPIVLVRTAQHAMALQVDALMGSREIVVKSLGAQFSAVPGLSGATVMGDGSVVVILDPHALVRQEIANSEFLLEAANQARLTQGSDAPAVAKVEKVYTVMVVDDSVTVRKVTTRFLEREGYNVFTAKDGVEALQLLQDDAPDVMLLDIEMPRMDGFEVAKNIRTTQRLKNLPIIMITSRTGEKHREHALSLGVNRYLGKPYQEETLLEAIRDLQDHD